MPHSWRVLASDIERVTKFECRTCSLVKTVYPSTTLPYPKILWQPKGGKAFYGKTPECQG